MGFKDSSALNWEHTSLLLFVSAPWTPGGEQLPLPQSPPNGLPCRDPREIGLANDELESL